MLAVGDRNATFMHLDVLFIAFVPLAVTVVALGVWGGRASMSISCASKQA